MSKKTRKATTAKTAAANGKSLQAATDVGPAPLAPGEVMVHRNLALLEVSEAADLTALLANSRIAPLITARIGETTAVATPEAARELHLALKKAKVSVTISGEFCA